MNASQQVMKSAGISFGKQIDLDKALHSLDKVGKYPLEDIHRIKNLLHVIENSYEELQNLTDKIISQYIDEVL